MSNSTLWRQNGDVFRPSPTAMTSPQLTPGVYTCGQDISGLFISRVSDRFTFAFKLYETYGDIVTRITRAWNQLPGGLGISLNGVKGTGKTVCAQEVANKLIDSSVAVLMVNAPVALGEILIHIEQDIVVILDEFEKTHDKDQQQSLLSVIDGMSRSKFKRMFIFTTNNLTVDDNLIDRPSRIRYRWSFSRLERHVIASIMDDILPRECDCFRNDIISYLESRSVLTMDGAKATIQEVAIFQQSPYDFENILNLSKRQATSFKVEILDKDRNPIMVAHEMLYTTDMCGKLLQQACGAGGVELINSIRARGSMLTIDNGSHRDVLKLIAATENEGEFIANVALPPSSTWYANMPKVTAMFGRDPRWLDARPQEWAIPAVLKKYELEQKLTSEEDSECDDWMDYDYVYGGTEALNLLIRVTPCFDQAIFKPNNMFAALAL